jgi:hypothetical protein
MEILTKTDRAMEMLSVLENPRHKEKEAIAGRLNMSVRQVYRAWNKVKKIREESLIYVRDLDKWKSYCMWLYRFFTEKWFPDPEKKFSKKENILLSKIENDLREMEESQG